MTSMPTCRVCHSQAAHPAFVAREMMYGRRDSFSYFKCVACGCLQIASVPEDLGSYYAHAYYSHSLQLQRSGIRGLLARARDRHAVTGRGFIGGWLGQRLPNLALDAIRPLGPTPSTRILDVGCGKGHLLLMLAALGFRDLTGMDPFATESVHYPEGPRILKQGIEAAQGEWDIIMFHHSLEHIPDQLQALAAAARVLNANGTCVVRVPLVDSEAWERYGVDWCQLDAPRHLYLHTRQSLEMIARQAGLKLDEVRYDSTDFQFWGSEQYQKDIPLTGERSYLVNRKASIFSAAQIRDFRRQSRHLNETMRGDQAIFYLRKAGIS